VHGIAPSPGLACARALAPIGRGEALVDLQYAQEKMEN